MKIVMRILIFIMVILFPTVVFAANANISISSQNAYVGDSVTVTVNCFAGTWNLAVSGAVNDTIVGFNMDISEIDLWEVLNKRKSYMASIKLHDPRFKDVVINNKIFFYGINGKEDGMCNLLKDYEEQ